MKRCFDLANFAKGKVSPNPNVGAVIVVNDTIIGEGFHKKYGQAHAEVNAFESINQSDNKLLHKSTIYISLEPCCIHGKTPPCSSLIIKKQIPEVVFSVFDQTPGVKGKSITLLEAEGIKASYGLLENQGIKINAIRNTFVKKRPYVILKYAKSADNFISKTNEQTWLTGYFAKVLVHKWRSEADAIIVGTNTAEIDNPKLTNRLYSGKNPLRIVLDKSLRLNKSLHLFDKSSPTWIINEQVNAQEENLKFIKLDFDHNLIPNLMTLLHKSNKSSLIVEGGQQLLNSFIDTGLWDEARIFTSDQYLNSGIKAPVLLTGELDSSIRVDKDKLDVFLNNADNNRAFSN